MIIIIEGPDGSGKTSLAEKLAQQTGYTYKHMSYPKTEEERVNMFNDYKSLIANSTNLILDRAWYSEMAYGPVMRQESMISYPDMYELERIVARKGGMVIHCNGPESTLWQRCQKRGEEYVLCRDDFKTVCSNFWDILSKCPHVIPVVNYSIPV